MNPPALYQLHCRWGTARDLPRILAIEAASFADAWTEENFRAALRHRDCIMVVAERGDRVEGFAVYQLFPTHLELLNLAVCPAARRTGVGAALIAKLLYKLKSHRREYLAATVRESNLTAQCFFRSCGLRARRVLANHYDDGEAGYRMLHVPSVSEWDAFGGEPVNRIASY